MALLELSTQPKKANPFARNHLIRDAIGQAIYDEMAVDKSIYLFGEGAHVKVHYDHPQIEKDFGDRVVTMPICEDGSINFAVGASLLGVKPVVDIITADFLYRAMDSICNTAAKLNFVRPDQPPSAIVIRAEFLTGGPTTGQRPEALFAHIPGLRVVIPSRPYDAYGLMRNALQTPGVTIFFEDRMIEDNGRWFQHDLAYGRPGYGLDGEIVPFGKALVRRMGQRGNVTIATYGFMCQRIERILQQYTPEDLHFDPEGNLRADLIDLRSIYPVDFVCLKFMLQRTGRLLIIEPDVTYGGVGAEIAASIVEAMPEVRVKRLGAARETIPAAMSLHDQILPTEEQIVAAITSDW